MIRICVFAAVLALAACNRPNLESTGGGYESAATVTGETAPAPEDQAPH